MITSSTLERSPCICCSARFDEHDEYCPKCQTPVSVTHSVAAAGGEHSFISVLGASNSGKTVYLGFLLDLLSKGPEDFYGAAASSFSFELQEYVITELERRAFPEKTPSEADAWQWVHCKLNLGNQKAARTADLISPDFAGEAIAMEISQAGLYPAVRHVVTRSKGIMILCDSVRVRDEGAGEDLFAMKLATYIAENHRLGNEAGAAQSQGPSVAVIFTKCDACPEAAENPVNFAANNTPRLYDFCRKTFKRVDFFAAGIAGSTGLLADSKGWQMRVPFHIQPYGVLEPLQWIVEGEEQPAKK